MQTAVSSKEISGLAGAVARPVFKVLIAYEDFAAGKHAKDTYDFLARQLGEDINFENQMWNFDVLRNIKLREMAVHDAVTADLIIISSHGVGELPFGLKVWIDTWATAEFKALALVNLIDRPKDEKAAPGSIRSYLQRVALEAKIGFFSQPDEWPEPDGSIEVSQISQRVSQASAMMANLIHEHAPALRGDIGE